MNTDGIQKRTYIGYEYKEITADNDKLAFLLDAYENFGWEIAETYPGNMGKEQVPIYSKMPAMVLKRNRKIRNKTELTRLQRHFEACIDEIEELERAKTSMATMWALIVGIIGTAFMAGSVFAVTAQPMHIIFSIVLAIPGFLGWIFPYFIYKKMVVKQTAKIRPLIEEKYEEIHEICERGHKLLNFD